LLIIFGVEDLIQFSIDYSKKLLHWLRNSCMVFHNSSDLTYLNSRFLGLLRTTYYRQSNKRVAKRLQACVKAERQYFKHLL